MADDADEAERPVPEAGSSAATHARTDRQSEGWSVETTPESLYLWQIAVLNARIDALQTRVDCSEQDLQHVIDRYEGVLQERHAHDGELCTDGGTSVQRDDGRSRDPDGVLGRVRARLRSLVD